jgi:hypothetical protein
VIVGALFIARNVRVETGTRNGGDTVSIDTPAGHLSVRAHERPGTALAGIPIYPGARAKQGSGGDAVVEWTSNSGASDKGFGVSASETVTSDPLDKVVEYYRAQLPNWLIVDERHGGVRLELRDGGYKRIVSIHEEFDGTHIGVASAGEPASN